MQQMQQHLHYSINTWGLFQQEEPGSDTAKGQSASETTVT